MLTAFQKLLWLCGCGLWATKMRKVFLVSLIFGLLLILGFFIFSQEKKTLGPSKKRLENSLIFNEAIIYQLKENQKPWEFHVKKASILKGKDEILLEENTGFLLENKKPIFKITAPTATIEQEKSEFVFLRPKIEKIENQKNALFQEIFCQRLLWQFDQRKFYGQGNVLGRGQKASFKSSQFLADEKMKKIFFEPVQLKYEGLEAFSDQGEYSLPNDIFLLLRNVKIVYNNLKLNAEKVLVYPKEKEILAFGQPVVVQRNGEILTSDEISFSLKTRKLKIKKIGELSVNLEEFK